MRVDQWGRSRKASGQQHFWAKGNIVEGPEAGRMIIQVAGPFGGTDIEMIRGPHPLLGITAPARGPLTAKNIRFIQ